MDEPKDELAERRRARQEFIEQFLCGECSFGLFHLLADGSILCANCGTQAADVYVTERKPH